MTNVYQRRLLESARLAETESLALWQQAGEAGRVARSYVLITVLLACSLFCGGTAARFDAIISLVQLIRRASQPHVAFLGRIPGTRRFSDRERHPNNELIPGVLIFRPESSLVYFNVEHVREVILNRARSESPAPRLVVLDLSAAPLVDLQSAHTLAGLADELTSAGVRFQAVEARSAVRVRLRGEGLDSKLGSVDRFTSVADVVDSMQQNGGCRDVR